MENKINIAEILKNCPTGMELDCKICNGVKFIKLDRNPNFPIVVRVNNGYEFILTKYGQVHNIDDAKCVIFPKGKTTWDGFQIPFKDGDILFVKSAYSWIFIYKESENKEDLYKYVGISYHPNHSYIVHDDCPLCCKKDVSKIRFATEEEKEKLFKTIKDNGYKWNSTTKTLEKLNVPKFKVGDRIKHKASSKISKIIDIRDDSYITGNVTGNVTVSSIPFSVADSDYELIQKFDISTLIPFESRVLVRDFNEEKWCPATWGIYDNNLEYPYTVEGGNQFLQCIPYNYDTKHLLGTTNDCDEYYKTWE